jgi:hypothetical protein
VIKHLSDEVTAGFRLLLRHLIAYLLKSRSKQIPVDNTALDFSPIYNKTYICRMIKLTQSSLDKLTELYTLAGYTIRMEKGNFKSGSCMIEAGKLIVLNKFSPVESRVTFLIESLHSIQIDESLLDDRRKNFLHEVLNSKSEAAEEENAITVEHTDDTQNTGE